MVYIVYLTFPYLATLAEELNVLHGNFILKHAYFMLVSTSWD